MLFAGGIAVGTSSDMMIRPFGAVVIGAAAGVLTNLAQRFLTVRVHKAVIIVENLLNVLCHMYCSHSCAKDSESWTGTRSMFSMDYLVW